MLNTHASGRSHTRAPDPGPAGLLSLTAAAIQRRWLMATQTSSPRRFAYRPAFDPRLPDGVWWPESRRLSEQLAKLYALWPPEAGRILGVHYSPPDWDDHPHSVAVPGLRITTAALPHDDTHQLKLTLRGGFRRSIRVIPPETPTRDAE